MQSGNTLDELLSSLGSVDLQKVTGQSRLVERNNDQAGASSTSTDSQPSGRLSCEVTLVNQAVDSSGEADSSKERQEGSDGCGDDDTEDHAGEIWVYCHKQDGIAEISRTKELHLILQVFGPEPLLEYQAESGFQTFELARGQRIFHVYRTNKPGEPARFSVRGQEGSRKGEDHVQTLDLGVAGDKESRPSRRLYIGNFSHRFRMA